MAKFNRGWVLSILLLVVIFGWMLLDEQGKKELDVQLIQGETMGTTYAIKFIGDPKPELKQEVDILLRQFNQSLSTYIPDSEVSKFNQDSLGIDNPSTYMREVMGESRKIWKLSGGAFDPTVMPLVNLWGFGFENRDSVNKEDIDTMMGMVGFDKVVMDAERVVKDHPDVMLDFSAIAKGYGVDIVSDYLEQKGIPNFMVDIGGEVYCSGNAVNGKPWKIGIEDPSRPEDREPLLILPLNDLAVATSGNYRNFYIKDGKKISHTLDPKTGYPVEHSLLSASVVSSNCMEADGMATALMVMGPEEAIDFAERKNIMAFLIYEDEDGELRQVASAKLGELLGAQPN